MTKATGDIDEIIANIKLHKQIAPYVEDEENYFPYINGLTLTRTEKAEESASPWTETAEESSVQNKEDGEESSVRNEEDGEESSVQAWEA
eukprot:79612-Prymnesium_polylepis.1